MRIAENEPLLDTVFSTIIDQCDIVPARVISGTQGGIRDQENVPVAGLSQLAVAGIFVPTGRLILSDLLANQRLSDYIKVYRHMDRGVFKM